MIDTEILQDYASEARELLDEMDNSLMRLEREGSSPELLNNIFRAVHCIKGSAEYIGLERSSTLTHGVENLLDRLREGVLRVDPPIVEFLFRAKDLILTLIAEVSKEHEEKTPISGMMDQLEVFLTRPAGAVQEPEPAPEAAEEAPPAIEPEPAEASAEPEQPTETEEIPSAPTEESAFAITAEIEEIQEAAKPVEGPFLTVDNFGEEEGEEEPPIQVSTLIGEDVDEVSAETAEEALAAAMDEETTEIPIPDQMTITSEARPAQSIEETVPSLLNMSLYLDDLQDGLHPGDIVGSLLDTVRELTRSMEFLGLSDAANILKDIEERISFIDTSTEKLPRKEIEELRGLLFSLRPYYPQGAIPWKQPPSEEPTVAPTEEITREDSSLSAELAKIPGIGEYVAAALEAAGYASMDDLARTDLGTLASVPGVDRVTAETILKYLGVITSAADWRPPARKPGERSLLADVDDELLKEFEGIFGDGHESKPTLPMVPAVNRAQDLLEELDSIGEDVDREIMEIFLSYGWEIMDKLRPYVQKINDKTADNNDLDSCAELIKSIRSSSTYMDYQNLAAFLDEWFEKTVWCSEHADSLDTQDFSFMEESLLRFQDFMRGLEVMLHPESAAKLEAAAPPALAPEPVPTASQPVAHSKAKPKQADRVRVSTVVAPAEAKLATRPKPAAQASSRTDTTAEIPTEEYMAQTAAKIKEAQQKAMAKPAYAPESQELTTQDGGAVRDSAEGAVVKTMRVDSGKVDILLNQVGELVVNRSYVEQLALELKNFHRTLASAKEIGKKEVQSIKDLSLKVGEASISLGRVATDLQEGVMKLRMLPVGQLFNRMPRLIRDLSRRVGKEVTLHMHGGDTEVDKRVIEQIYNPLVHLIRNAVDHGIEDKETRKKLGKAEEGSITLSAYSQGNQVIIDVEDDGGGISSSAVAEKAVESRLVDAQDAKTLGTQEIYNLLFMPGFSTSKKVTRTSGRGVGMDVVKKDVEKINGHVEIESWENKGTRISIKIPLTLAIIQTLLIRASKHVFAVPLTSVREIIQVSPREIITIEGFEVIKFREETIPVLRVSEVFKLKNHDASKHPRFLVLAAAGVKTVGFLVEELIGEQDVVIKPLAEHVCESRGLAGSTILGDGTIALVLDVMEVIEDVIAQQRQLAQSMPRHMQVDPKNELHDARDI